MKMDYSKLPAVWARIITDGDHGAGKTTLAREIAKRLDVRMVSFDQYLPGILGDERPYLEQLNCDALRNDILASVPRVIVEGVLALKVMAKIEVSYDFHIFVKRLNGFVGWEFGQYLNPKSKLPFSKLDREVIQYYRECKPFEVCNLELCRDICDC